MRLNQISNQDALTQLVVATMMRESVILQNAEFYSMVGNADYRRTASTAAMGDFRSLDANYAANLQTPGFANPTLKILGGHVQVDQAHERRGADIDSVRAVDLLAAARNNGRQFQSYFINGDSGVDAKQFDGVKTIMPVAQVAQFGAGADGHAVTLGSDNAAKLAQQKFLEYIDELIAMVDGGANLLLMDQTTLSRLTSIARESVTWVKNEFGKLIAIYGDVPVAVAGRDKAGTKIIPHTEVVGASNDCTSIYALRFGEGSDLSIATNIGMDVQDQGLVGVHYTHKAEMDLDLALLNNKAIARGTGIRIV